MFSDLQVLPHQSKFSIRLSKESKLFSKKSKESLKTKKRVLNNLGLAAGRSTKARKQNK